jgi:hypothetical protein
MTANVTHRRGSQDGERDRGGTALAVGRTKAFGKEKKRKKKTEAKRKRQKKRGHVRARPGCNVFFSLALLGKVLFDSSFFFVFFL